jgi:hypothetical protein
MYYVICPQCGTENAGSWLECEKCNTSLEGIQRTKSPEAPPAEAERELFVYELYIDEDDTTGYTIPQTHCSSCYSDQPEFRTYLKIAQSSVNEYYANKVIAKTLTLEFQFPLCKKCYYDLAVFTGLKGVEGYVPKNYDPTCKEDPKLKRASLILGILFGLSLLPMPIYANKPVLLILPALFLVAWIVIAKRVKSYDKELKKSLQAEAKSRYGVALVAGCKGDYPGRTLFKAGSETARYHYQLQFHNKQYRDLVAEANK